MSSQTITENITEKEKQRRMAISKAMRLKFQTMSPQEREERLERISAKARLKNTLYNDFISKLRYGNFKEKN